jgi:hypothetical protein
MTPEELAAIAYDIEEEDPIEWNELNITKLEAYRLMASQVLELFADMDKEALMATIVKMQVENFALHLKVLRDALP